MHLNKTIIKRRKPKNLTVQDAALFENEFERKIEAAGIKEKNLVFCNHEKAFTPLGIIEESTVYKWTLPGQLKWSWQQLVKFRFKHIKTEKPIVYIGDEFSFGYFHFSVDTLQKLWMAEKRFSNGFTLFLNYSSLNAYHKKLLAPFNIKRVVLNEKAEDHYLGKVFFPEHPCKPINTSNARPEIILELRNKILDYYKIKKNTAYEKVYVSRKMAKNRHVLNETEVEELLEKQGFKIVCFENYTFEEQLSIGLSASILIGLHGAGLTNMMYMEKRAKIVELRQKDDTHNNCYFSLASDCELDYYYLLCETTDKNNVHCADFHVDIEKLNRLVSQFLI